jgi:hypothetical protein
MAKVE